MEIFDLIVIGGGPGGYNAAERAAHAGKKTLLIEKNALGGVCLNEGCIPSKSLLYSAKTFAQARHAAAYGVHCGDVTIDQAAVIRRKAKVVRTLVAGVKAKLKQAGVTVVMGAAKILGQQTQGILVAAGEETYCGRDLIIATGSSHVIPPLPGIQAHMGSLVLTNREILELPEIPQRLVIIGGGVIGLEMACYFSTVGSQVTVVELQDHIAGVTDWEISNMLQKMLEKQGITFLLGHSVEAVEASVVLVKAPDGQVLRLKADKVLLSIGRRANCADLGLEAIGVNYDRAIPTDRQCRTNHPHVYAIGDVNGHHMLAHTAYREGEVAVSAILGQDDTMDYAANPSVIYTQPEVAAVGMTEEDCRAAGVEYQVARLSMRFSGRFLAENEGGDGLCKVIIHSQTRQVLGVHLLGSYAGEIIWGAADMVRQQMVVEDARKIIFPHPTVSEILRETLWTIPEV